MQKKLAKKTFFPLKWRRNTFNNLESCENNEKFYSRANEEKTLLNSMQKKLAKKTFFPLKWRRKTFNNLNYS
jgi:hypothetical protein